MSTDITPHVYRTKLGNLTAKSVLALIGEVANHEGFGWPSLERIAEQTEVSERTVQRLVQVFGEIGLVKRVTHTLPGGRRVTAMQIAVEMLGTDLRAAFSAAYVKAQRKGARDEAAKCRSDAAGNVAETGEPVAETPASVAATEPLKPLIGGTANEPSKNLSPVPPQAGACIAEDAQPATGDELTDEQRSHLDGIADPARREMFRRHYVDDNRAVRAAADRAAVEQRARLAEVARMRAAIPNTSQGVAYVLRHAGMVDRGRRRGIAAVLQAVLEREREDGAEPWETAPKLAQAWQRYRASGHMLRFVYGPVKFFELGVWRDERGWAWDEAKLAHNAAASIGRMQ